MSALVDALNARDLGAVGRIVHPEVEFRSVLATAEGELYFGLDGIRKWADNVDSTWDGFELELAEFHEAGRTGR